jgi:hypothetical protein
MSNTVRGIPYGSGPVMPIPNQSYRDIALSFKVQADSGRVLYALSIPEYIEAWLQIPDVSDFRFVFNPDTREAFRVDLYEKESLRACVHGTCRVVGENQVKYIWKTTSSARTTETLVNMRLKYSSAGCILRLKHSGFNDPAESAWCLKVWHQSLERLCRLMKKN